MKKTARRALVRAKATLAMGIDAVCGAAARSLLGGVGDGRTLFVFYDLKSNPLSYDFMWNLCVAECERLKRGLERLHIVFVKGDDWVDGTERNPNYRAVVDGEARRWRFQNILVPACDLVPSVSGFTFCESRALAGTWARLAGDRRLPRDYTALVPLAFTSKAELFEAHEAGLPVQAITATDQGLRYAQQWLDAHAGGKRPVTITLRQYGFETARNSNLAAWGRFARKLIDDGFFPIIIPDTDCAMLAPPPELEGLPFCAEAALHLGLRTALYRLAWLNLASSGGPPFGLCILQADTRALIFKVVVDNEKLASAKKMRKIGLPVDTRWPFLSPFQRVLWRTPDDFESIVKEFDALAAEIEAFEATEADPKRSLERAGSA